jgi:SET domain-containing protein
MAKSKAKGRPVNKWLVVRRSKVHGNGCFARRDIPKGTRIIEYLGERMSHKEADRRYENEDAGNNHTFLFIADRRTVIDATVGGNEARWINHSCDGNCESEIEKSRVFIDARRDIRKGEELGYDYQIGRDKSDPPNVDEIYACRCGSPKCRGSMLWPPKRKARAPARKRKAVRKAGSPAAKRATTRGSTARRASVKRGKEQRA